jgi:periplasmic protein CpxP/Spy
MSSFTNPIAISSPLVRSLAIATLMGATMLAGPLMSDARADGATSTAIQLTQAAPPQTQADATPAATKAETVEERITNLHAALQITPAEDAKWNSVAQAMRENAANMDKLVAENRLTPPQNMTAVGDLKTYEKFAQAHVKGLKNLIASFSKLYAAMPAAQQKNADAVFQNFGHEQSPAHS